MPFCAQHVARLSAHGSSFRPFSPRPLSPKDISRAQSLLAKALRYILDAPETPNVPMPSVTLVASSWAEQARTGGEGKSAHDEGNGAKLRRTLSEAALAK